MIGRRGTVRLSALIGVLCLAQSGCVLAGDVLNPSVFSALGLARSAIIPDQGVVLMVFNNETDSDALFYGFSARNADNFGVGARNFTTFVSAGETRNEAIECPVDLLGTGQIEGAGFTTVAATAGGGDIEFAGGVLINGTGFVCGDVIEVRLTQAGTGDNAAFAVVVQVLPGQ